MILIILRILMFWASGHLVNRRERISIDRIQIAEITAEYSADKT